MSTCTTKKNATRKDVWDCFLEFRRLNKNPILLDSSGGWSFVCVPDSVQPEWDERLQFLDKFWGGIESSKSRDSEAPFVGGWVGFMCYDFGLELMGISSQHRSKLPKMFWRYCSEVHAFHVDEEPVEEGLNFTLSALHSSISKAEYVEKIKEIHSLLRAGETYQVNFAQEFKADFSGDSFDLYRALFAANPSAMCFFAEADDWSVVSNSPERLFSLREGMLRVEPVKGTVAHDEDPQFLLDDEKSYAELTMIVDLMRNDLGKIAKIGTVEVLKHQELMELKNVWHTYSVVEAELDTTKTIADVLRALFPGGSVTGCPKYRTMEIIDRLEAFSRGAYCGSAGYVSKNGSADFNIMIRTATVQGGQLSFPSGGGIVMDSDPALEYEETLHKSGVLRQLTS